MPSDKKQEKKKQEQPVDPEDGGDDDEYDDDEYYTDCGCLPCELARWQIIAIVAVVVCAVIGIAVAAVVIFLSGGDSDDSGGSARGVEYPSDQIFYVQVENQYVHGTLGSATYAVSNYMKAGESTPREDTNKPSTDIKTTFSSAEGGIARLDVTVIIDFDLDGSVDCRDDFSPMVAIDSGEFGEWTSQQSCTYTLGGTYLHKVRVKVTPQ